MNSTPSNPVFWRLSTLLSLETQQVHELACWAVGTLTSYRLVLGRCLLALDQSKAYKSFGCSTAIHYGSAKLGLSTRLARECRRVARLLLGLPQLTLAAEKGTLSWSKLREIVRVAVPHTEDYWLELAARHDAATLQALVKRTPQGEIPGEADLEGTRSTEFRCAASPRLIQMFQQARRMFSLEREEALTGADTLECLLAAFFSSQPLDSEVLKKAREEADKDLQAEAARQLPLVEEARNLAEEMGLLESEALAKQEPLSKTPLSEPIETAPTADSGVNLQANEADSTPQFYTSPTELEANTGSKPQNCGCCPSSSGQELHEMLSQALGTQTERLSGVVLQTETPKKKATWQNPRLRFNPRSRHTTPAQKKEILRRDAWCCSTPGCPNKVWLEIHHLEPYSEGGATERENLLSLCTGCHRNVHKGLLKITPLPKGAFRFTDENDQALDHQANLQLAGWLDYWMGWQKGPDNSHQARAADGAWVVF